MLEDVVRAEIDAQLLQCNRAGRAERAIRSILIDVLRVMRMSAREWNGRHFNPRLPPEILCECFTFLTQSERRTAMRVSHHWRSVIIEEPSFWTRPVLSARSDLTLFHELVRRAGTLPLHIVVRGAAPAAELCQYMQQTASLDVDGGRDAVPGLELILTAEAPHLTRMTLKAYRNSMTGGHSDTLNIPPTLLFEQPVLRYLRMNAFSLPPQCPALRRLHEFDGYIDRDNIETSNIRLLFDLCPELDSLTLRILGDFIADVALLPSRPSKSLTSISIHVLGDSADLRPHLRSIESHSLPNVTFGIYGLDPDNQEYLLEAYQSFHAISITHSDPPWPHMVIRIDSDPAVENRRLHLTDIGDWFDHVIWSLRDDSRFNNVAVLTVWHVHVYTIFSGSCPQLPHLHTLEVVAPYRVESHNVLGSHVGPDIADLTFPWTHIPDDNPDGFSDFSSRRIRPQPATYRFPSLTSFTLYTVPSALQTEGKMPYIRLAALCDFLSREIDMNAPPLRRTFLLQDIDIAEPIVSSYFTEIASVFQDITLSNVCFGVAA